MRLALVAAALYALAHASGAAAAAAPVPQYTYPSCQGIAQVPGYDHCGHNH